MMSLKYPCIVKEVELTKLNQTDLQHMLQNLQEPTNPSMWPTLEATWHFTNMDPQALPWQVVHETEAFQSLPQ